MPTAIATKIVPGREPNDCAICVLAMYLGRSYEDVLRVVAVNTTSVVTAGATSQTPTTEFICATPTEFFLHMQGKGWLFLFRLVTRMTQRVHQCSTIRPSIT